MRKISDHEGVHMGNWLATLVSLAVLSTTSRMASHGAEPTSVALVTCVLRRFPAIVRELRRRHNRRRPLAVIHDEYDVQDLLRGVLRGLFVDVRDEEHTPSHGAVHSRMDMLLKR